MALFASVSSTLDVAHALAADGAPAGTLVLADEQTQGRGRAGRSWASAAGAGIWLTLLERPRAAATLAVTTLRLGVAAASVLDAFASARVQIKWPNDLYLSGGKLAGVLVESRWRGERLDWMAIGVGLNVRQPPGVPNAAALRPATARLDVLAALVPALRAAADRTGPLLPEELHEYASRDLAVGRRCSTPVAGTVAGIAADGALIVSTPSGPHHCRSGSLTLEVSG